MDTRAVLGTVSESNARLWVVRKVSGIASGTFSLGCFCLSLEVGLWIEMVNPLSLSVASGKVRN